MDLSPEYSTSVYRDEVFSHKQNCCYDQQGCTKKAQWVYTIGAGLAHLDGHVQLYTCSFHDVQVRKHAENIVKKIMAQMRVNNP